MPENPKPPDEGTPSTQNVDMQGLIDAMRDAIAAQSANGDDDDDTPPSPPPAEQADDFEERVTKLLESDDTQGALSLVREEAQKLAQQGDPVSRTALSRAARDLASAQIDDFTRWEPEVRKLAKKRGLNPDAWLTTEQWREAVDYVRAQNFDSVVDEEMEKRRAQWIEEYEKDRRGKSRGLDGGSGSTGEAGIELPEGVSLEDLPEHGRTIARALGIPLAAYAKQCKRLEAYEYEPGSCDNAPLFEDELDEYGKPIIKPGRF